MNPPKKSYLNWVPHPVLGYGPPNPIHVELQADPKVIREELKNQRRRHTVRVKSKLP